MQISRFLLHLTRCIATKKPKSSLLTAATMLPVSPLSSPSKLAVPNRLSYASSSSIAARRQVFRASSLSSPSQPADATAAGVSEAPWWKQEHPAVQAQPHKVGSVHLIMGPMFAGKSTALCSKVRTLRSEGHNVAIVNSALDTRSSFNTVGTHDGDSLPAVPVQRLMDFVGKPEYEWATHICVDEAQVS